MPPSDSTPIYAVAHTAFWLYYLLAARTRVEGLETFPRRGGCVVACNHTLGNDYFPLGINAPRQIWYMTKVEAYAYSPIIDWLLTTGGTVPVNRKTGDVHALQKAVDVVRSGKVLGMFPEGTRSRTGVLQRGKTGATRIALEANAPVVPAAVIGAQAAFRNFPRFWRRPELIVRFGKPFLLEGEPGDRAAIAAGTRRIMKEIAALLPPEMRGEWGDESASMPKAMHSSVVSPG